MAYLFGKFGMSNLGNTSGTSGTVNRGIVFAGGNNVTLSQSVNGSSATLSISAANQSVQTQHLHNLTLSGNTAGVMAHVSSGTLTLAGGNNITLSQNGNAITVSGASPINPNISLYALGNTTQSSSSVINAASLSFNGLGAMTVGYSNGSIQLSSPVQTAQTQSNIQAIYDGANSISTGTIRYSNSNGVSFGINGQTLTASHNGITSQTNQSLGLYAVGNTTHSSSTTLDARTLSFNGAGIASVGYTNGSVVISVPGAAPSPVNLSAGTTSNNLGTVVFSNSNNVSFGLNGSTITASAAGGGGGIALANSQTTYTSGTAHMVASGALTIGSTTGQSFNLSVPNTSVLSATGGLSISTTGSTVSLGFPSPVTWSYFNPQDAYPLAAGQHGQATLHLRPAQFQNVQFDRIVLPIVHSNATNSSGSQTASFWVGIYTRNNTALSLASSTSASYAVTASGTAGNYSLFGGQRLLTIGSTNTILEGQYYIGIISRTTSGGANASISQLVASQINSNFSGILGVASNASAQQTRGLGYYSASTTAMPASVAFTDIRGTASMALRQPAVYFLSQTF